MPIFVVAVVCAALLAPTTLVAQAADSGGPQAAVAAKKKCKQIKNRAKRKRCKKRRAAQAPAVDYVGQARAFLAGHTYTNPASPGGNAFSGTTRIDVCTNGTYRWRSESNSGLPWTTTWEGTWSVSSATATGAVVAVTTQNFQKQGVGGPPPPPPSWSLGVGFVSDTLVYVFGTYDFSRAPGVC